MQALLAFAAIVAFDPVEDFAMPCLLVDGKMEYYSKLLLLVVLPLLVALGLSLLTFAKHMAHAHIRHRRDSKRINKKWTTAAMKALGSRKGKAAGTLGVDEAALYRRHMQGSAKRALGTCLSLVAMIMPVIDCGVYIF